MLTCNVCLSLDAKQYYNPSHVVYRYDLNNIQSNQDSIVALFYNAYCKRSQNTYVPLVFYMRLLTKYGELT